VVRRTILSQSSFSTPHYLTLPSDMAFPEADIEQKQEVEVEDGRLTLYLMIHILIHVPGEICSGSSSELTETERLDKEMVERWKGEADSILVFVRASSTILRIYPSKERVPKAGLFTAVVSVSIVESYKWLSPDSGDETVARLNVAIDVLTQTSQQFYNNSHGIPVQSITVASSPPFQLAQEVLAVNILWFNSLVMSLGCAIIATLIQKWARRYLSLTQGHGTPAQRARVRRLLSNGLIRFRANWFRQLLGMLLHFSIFLYCLGLIFFIFHIGQDIDNNLASSAAGYLFFCFLIYAIMTVLPFFFLSCPYSTPYTPITWRFYHLCMFVICSPILAVVYLLLAVLTKLVASSWLEKLKKKTKKYMLKHMLRFWHGRKRSIEMYGAKATNANILPK
jgi:hypothetical protein